jgi:hypothetical protein
MVHRGWGPGQSKKYKSPTRPKGRCDGGHPSTPVEIPLLDTGNTEDSTQQRNPAGQDFLFINTTRPNQARDREVQKRVRRHARKQRSQVPTAPPFSIPPPLGAPTSLTTFTYPMHLSTSTHTLLAHYFTHASTRMFPGHLAHCFASNPLRSPAWFRYAVHDEAMLSAVLYSACVYLYLLGDARSRNALRASRVPCGAREREMLYWQSRVMRVVQETVVTSCEREVPDSVLGAISCLAVGEAVMGNQRRWSVHMQGLQQILLARGEEGWSRLSPLMRAKLRRYSPFPLEARLLPPFPSRSGDSI